MSLEWIFKNRLKNLSYTQFLGLVTEFEAAVKREVGNEACPLRIHSLNGSVTHSVFSELGTGDDGDHNTQLITPNLSDITPEIFGESTRILVDLGPPSRHAIGHMDFVDYSPREVSFRCTIPDWPEKETNVFMEMLTKFPKRII